ncbi:voltage-dependent anion-selective channel protein 1-like [Rattus norvegicus]|uniref:voltage-dependent anion-selective channel protein 1-like n=1 Tax=Rattus norvegicus TaxID=10116 RepID=UPI0003D0D8BA|nr:voltage-dependent anion-selective channel protein 1-like [Rattus norvegicus]
MRVLYNRLPAKYCWSAHFYIVNGYVPGHTAEVSSCDGNRCQDSVVQKAQDASPGQGIPNTPRKSEKFKEQKVFLKSIRQNSDLYWEKSAKIKTGYKREHINLGCDVDFDIAGPSIWGALVLGYEGWLAGYQMNFETSKFRVTQSNFAVGYKTDEFQLHSNVNDGTEFGGSIYQKVNKKLETAVNLAWTTGNSNTHFGIAAKYQVDPDACFSVKVNNSSLIGLGYTQTLKPGIKLTLSALLDGKNVNVGGHKLGLGLEFQA